MGDERLTREDEELLRRFAGATLRWVGWWLQRHVTADDPARAVGAVTTLCGRRIPVAEFAPESPEFQRPECPDCWRGFVVLSTGRAPRIWRDRSPYPPGS